MVMIAILVGGETAQAYTFTTASMTGEVGDYRVTMKLTINTNTGRVSGWYNYNSKGAKNKIQLSGTMKGEPINVAPMTLTETVKGKKTGTFKGFGVQAAEAKDIMALGHHRQVKGWNLT